jgi:hypothetical protein
MVSCMATKKVTVTIPEDLLELVDWLQEEHSPVTEDERVAALDELEDLDAEHERRRASGQRDAGEAA